jgi:hypothetical protein
VLNLGSRLDVFKSLYKRFSEIKRYCLSIFSLSASDVVHCSEYLWHYNILSIFSGYTMNQCLPPISFSP